MPVVFDPDAGIRDFGGTPESRFCEGPSFTYGDDPDNLLNLDLDVFGITGIRITVDLLDPGAANPWSNGVNGEVYVSLGTFVPEGLPNVSPDFSVSETTAVIPATSTPLSVVIPIVRIRAVASHPGWHVGSTTLIDSVFFSAASATGGT